MQYIVSYVVWFLKYLIRRECAYESCPVHTFLNCNNESCYTLNEWFVTYVSYYFPTY